MTRGRLRRRGGAGEVHRMEDLSSDFAACMAFHGPEGAELNV